MKVLLHTCCSCCALGAIEILSNNRHKITCYFYNPNIHPSSEYLARHRSMVDFAKKRGVDLLTGSYEIERYFDAIGDKYIDRCVDCYSLRLDETARFARDNEFDAISTTLLTSVYQDHDQVRRLGEQASKKRGIHFAYFDNRADFRANQKKSKELEMYRQKYCGCIFSERERYLSKIIKTYSI